MRIEMEPRSLSVAILILSTIILALLPSNNNPDHAKAATAAARARRGGGSPETILVPLAGHGGARITLALLPHDLSLAGFANGSRHWYAFPGHEHVIGNIAGTTTTLPFGNTYRDLVCGLANLRNLPLGRDPALRAVAAAASTTGDDDDELKRGLATLMVTTSESLRLTPVMEAVGGGWETGDARLTEEHLRYIEHWDTISFELVRANKTGVWDGPFTELLRKHAGIHSKEEALAVVGVIANPTLAQLLMAHARSA